jgi:hypothetical protein
MGTGKEEAKEDKISGSRRTHSVESNAYKILIRKSEGRRPLGKPRCRWKKNYKMDL